ncbi:MAG: response regulator transcription factor, partial [Bacteroidales bacterium]|nr:response regulator transcription factor [Bacteroidales bacterium]
MEQKTKLLLAEDDENLGLLLKEYLIAKGFAADLYPDGEAAFKGFMKEHYDICILDIMMPKKDGFTLAKDIRIINSDIPIIFLTAKNLKDDVIEGFKIGADDYITKPFSMEELIFRIEAILRRTSQESLSAAEPLFTLGKYTFDTRKQTLSDETDTVKLTTKESDLLKLLCQNANKVLERNYALKS